MAGQRSAAKRDPAIQHFVQTPRLVFPMDGRVKPGHDEWG
jgi:hypothetical protein